ncbi:ATP-binding cassette domain-containing protein [Candidatus Liberibacter solanacearum]|nr:ATP-binding cassette domain-containing protein [Candidatus Liberibacter solanacearum]
MMHIYDSVIGTQSQTNLIALSVITLFLYALFFGFDLIRSRMFIESSHSIERLFKFYIITTIKKHDSDHTSLLSTVSALDQLKQFIRSPILPAFFDLLFTPIFIISSLCIHPLLGSWAIVSAILLLTTSYLFQKKNERLEQRNATNQQNEINFSKAILSNPEYMHIPTTRDFLLTHWDQRRFSSQASQSLIAKKNFFGVSLIKTLRMTLQSSILGTGAWLVIHQNLSAGSIIATSIITTRAIAPLEQMMNAKKYLKIGFESLKYLIDLKKNSDLLNSSNQTNHPITTQLPNSTIIFNNITLRHKKTSRLICKNLSFTIPEGTCCVVFGPNCCGKTSFFLCMLGLHSLENGTISFGDREISRNFIEYFPTQIGYLSQNCTLFPMNIIENITLSNDENSLKIAQKATKTIGCDDDISSLKDGYQTICPSQAISDNLAQKICLSRIIAHNPQILLIDESLHQLDNVTKNNFYMLLKKFKENKKTIIIASHDRKIIDISDFALIFNPITDPFFGSIQDIFNTKVSANTQIKT